MINKNRWAGWFLGTVLLLVTLACSLPTASLPGSGPTPTPVGDTLQFNLPLYRAGVPPGENVPGTRLGYLGTADSGGYRVSIDGQELVKQTADSFFWSGVLAPGVFGNYNLRIAAEGLGELQVAGPVELFVLDFVPAEVDTIPASDSFLPYRFIPISYRVPVGWQVPGSTVTYLGSIEQGGNTLAQFVNGGVPLTLALGDSVLYTGSLRDNVYIRYNLRLSRIDADEARLDGTADLWVQP